MIVEELERSELVVDGKEVRRSKLAEWEANILWKKTASYIKYLSSLRDLDQEQDNLEVDEMSRLAGVS